MLRQREEQPKINAFLGKDTSFNGTLVFEGAVRIDGSMEGNIKTNDTLVLSETSKIKADIEAGIVKISGSFDGKIIAKERVELYKPANISGVINTPSITIEDGVIFNGTIEMSKTKTTLKEVKSEKKGFDSSKLENE
ncbi:MAG: polymer-forming cytoskeletal protein [Deferribacterota bacterium]|nr:polymer-forming cytoskeletal protein [Deferribacterota bacterium]